jgi:hypothetical protein
MKCISLWQPWATLWLLGVKRYETRSWHTKHTGPLLVHAATKWDRKTADLCLTEPFRSVLIAAGLDPRNGFRDALVRGAILGQVDLTGWKYVEDLTGVLPKTKRHPSITDQELTFGNFGRGRYAWDATRRIVYRTPVPFAGKQLLFNVPDALVTEAVR